MTRNEKVQLAVAVANINGVGSDQVIRFVKERSGLKNVTPTEVRDAGYRYAHLLNEKED